MGAVVLEQGVGAVQDVSGLSVLLTSKMPPRSGTGQRQVDAQALWRCGPALCDLCSGSNKVRGILGGIVRSQRILPPCPKHYLGPGKLECDVRNRSEGRNLKETTQNHASAVTISKIRKAPGPNFSLSASY